MIGAAIVGTRHFELRLPRSVLAPRAARQALDRVAELPHYPDLRFIAQLLTSELAANCIRHAGPTVNDVSLSLVWDEETLRVEVADDGPGFDALALLSAHRRGNERHRGLVLLDALADRWGYCRGEGEGSRVWFELDLVPGRRPWRGREPVRGSAQPAV